MSIVCLHNILCQSGPLTKFALSRFCREGDAFLFLDAVGTLEIFGQETVTAVHFFLYLNEEYDGESFVPLRLLVFFNASW